MTKTATAARLDGPGLKRLRKAPNAESIRQSVLTDQANGRAKARAKIAASAAKMPAEAPRARLAANAAPGEAAKSASKAPKGGGKRAAILGSAQAGVLPSPPDFTANTHARLRPKLAAVVALVAAGDVEGLRAYTYAGFISSSPRAILKYRDLALVALEARAAKAAACCARALIAGAAALSPSP